MANISDTIEQFIKSFFGDSDSIQLSRNDLAHYFGVSPSQISYVLTTRFSVDRGYVIESKRGGGGSVTVAKIVGTKDDFLPELLKQTDSLDALTFNKAASMTDRLARDGIITDGEAAIVKSAIGDRALAVPMADALRKNIFKEILVGLIRR